MFSAFVVPLLLLVDSPAPLAPLVTGDYLEVRSCDVFTGPCYANCEVNEVGREATLAWKVRSGAIDGVEISGLSIVAVVKASRTLGDPYKNPLPSKSALLVDQRASGEQRAALKKFALQQLGPLAGTLVAELSVPIRLEVGCCEKKGCGKLVAGDVVSAETRCLSDGDHICGNETAFYPPLSSGVDAIPAFTVDNRVDCTDAFDARWSLPDKRGAFVGGFSAAVPALVACCVGLGGEDDTGPTTVAKDKSAVAPDAADSPYALAPLAGDDAAPPAELKDAIAAALADRPVRLTKDGKPLYDLWLVREIELREKPDTGTGIKFGEIAMGALVGVLRAHGAESDYRQAAIQKGVYLLRYAVQPNNGNHLGTADTRDFVILSGPDDDIDPAAITDEDKLVERSLLVSPTDHCVILYLRQPNSDSAEPALVKHAERDEWRADLTVHAKSKTEQAESKELRLGLVLIGVSPHP